MRFVAVTKRNFDFVTYGTIKFTVILPVLIFKIRITITCIMIIIRSCLLYQSMESIWEIYNRGETLLKQSAVTYGTITYGTMTGQIDAYHIFFYQKNVIFRFQLRIWTNPKFQNRKFWKIENITFDRPRTQEEIRFHR